MHGDKEGFSEFSCYYDDEKYEVIYRTWENEFNEFLRTWTVNEYLTLNPNKKITIPHLHLDDVLLINAHCIELRSYPVIKNGKIFSYIEKTFDYEKGFINEIPRENRFWVEDDEYDGWEYGMPKK